MLSGILPVICIQVPSLPDIAFLPKDHSAALLMICMIAVSGE